MENTENKKKRICYNYHGSGVKTLNGFGLFFAIIGSISTIITLVGIIGIVGDVASLVSLFLPVCLMSFAFCAICYGLSGIARTALLKFALLKEQYDFIEEV